MSALGTASRRLASAEWEKLRGAARERFDPGDLAGLPDVAQRYLRHALTPGVPLSPCVELVMHGQIRLGGWRSFVARQVISPGRGYVWAATVRGTGMRVSGFDRYGDGQGQMRWKLLGAVPIVHDDGPDVTRSAAGRLAAEAVLCPTALVDRRWEALGADRVRVIQEVDGQQLDVTLHVDAAGSLRSVSMLRWGSPTRGPYELYPFGAEVQEEADFDGVRIPTRFRAAWWFGTERQEEGEFFRAEITQARFAGLG